MGTREESERTKEKLIEAAGEIFSQVGFEGANVRQIAAQAQVAFGTINYHFGGKEGLYRATLREACRPMEDIKTAEKMLLRLPPREALRAMVREILQTFAAEDVNWRARLLDRECLDLSPAFRELIRDHWVPELELFCRILGRAADCDPGDDVVFLAALELYGAAMTLMTYRKLIEELAPGLVERVRAADFHVDRLTNLAIIAAQYGRENK